ncbi:MAG: helix-turn-helix transcriptional regulator [Spirochaetes bacterium]|nr:helix-turn-helix transcriptional regulator [Spirochaetota bacterium]
MSKVNMMIDECRDADKAMANTAGPQEALYSSCIDPGETGSSRVIYIHVTSARDDSRQTRHGIDVVGDGGLNERGMPATSVRVISENSIVGVCRFNRQSPFSDRDARALSDLLDSIMLQFESEGPRGRKSAGAGHGRDYQISPATREKLKQAIAYIQANYTSDISRENLAASLDISPNHMSKCFRVYTGKRLKEFINELRVRDAAEKLIERDDSIITVAFSAGFESLSTFNRMFLRVMGVAPAAYRERNRPSR